MNSFAWIQSAMLALALSGCGEIYHLPGHHESNKLCPPPVTMTQGHSRRLLTTGAERFFVALPPLSHVRSSNPEVAAVGGSGWTVYLTANRPGTARVYYDASPENLGFEVTVLPAKP